ncbi:MAG: head decoration protein [Chloroflexi bacterium]|nr:head decoration protein [Chloroflexota bacterium]
MALRDPKYGNVDAFTPENFIAGDFPRHTDTVTIASGENLTAGSVLGEVSADGKFKLSASAAGDGSEVPVAVLQTAVDASGGDRKAPVWFTGCLNEDALVFGAGHNKASAKPGLRVRCIFLKTLVGA